MNFPVVTAIEFNFTGDLSICHLDGTRLGFDA